MDTAIRRRKKKKLDFCLLKFFFTHNDMRIRVTNNVMAERIYSIFPEYIKRVCGLSVSNDYRGGIRIFIL